MQDRALTVRPMKADEHSQVVALIIEGLTERWGTYDAAKNLDLAQFPENFTDSLILVASNGGAPLGVGILRPSNNEESEIVRMSVRRELRRTGIAGKILAELLAAAHKNGTKTVRVETTATWRSAVAFYEKYGFCRTHMHEGDQHFALEL
ncbi:GNAT family N-acetyltransferase [Aquabacterium humicola]|uniref:GNAT family N-acetyltransferase n=1 Tax=Aquabacterium humicola TaxID=3237377 RepID=UPI0025435B9A|nr:GNAT family N-acetyltransferase [Rubrivivax pictus]